MSENNQAAGAQSGPVERRVMLWRRYRFRVAAEDYRPVKFPPPGPYWCTGYTEEGNILVVYLPAGESIEDWWPDAEHIECQDAEKPTFSDRFPRPGWWA